MEQTLSARERLIQATSHLLDIQGYHATGLNQIIKEGGAPKGSLYYYFPEGKEELVAEAIGKHGDAITEQIRGMLAESGDPAEAIYAILMFIANKFIDTDCIKAGSIASVALETAHVSERLRDVCRRIYDAWQAAYAGILMESGFPAARASQIATLVTASIEGAVVMCRAHRGPEPMIAVARELKLLIEHAQREMRR
ncbi:TetR/AcrR family transcriptional regulator [Cohnella nanjingensis]|uniref:TetR/AcrR family transcriptional regulator n=1 Tax=Cohnella nanjingensis TaxID=1387779 RepID=A0A7X0VFC8_9BACL|nr:TetR/AcrR family transcriptional regulator [Cohnella nanjingensis]MBB6670479.1 TetR/AcrR family transcriptional regulator [Cohnella nanjingensis]